MCNRSQLSLLQSALCTMMRQTTGTIADGEFIGMEMPILDGAERKYNNEKLSVIFPPGQIKHQLID